MKYIKQAIIWGLKYGITIGIAIGFTLILIYSGIHGMLYLSFENLLIEYIIFAISGFTFCAMAVVYKIEGWSLLKKTSVYFIALLCVFVPCFIIGACMPASPIAIAIYIGVFAIFFLCFWLGWYFYWKGEIRKINEAIKNKN